MKSKATRPPAQRELIEAVTIDPHNARALAALGRLREESGDTTQALTNYQRSLANQPQPAASGRPRGRDQGAWASVTGLTPRTARGR